MYMHVPPQGYVLVFKLFSDEHCLVYWSPSNTMVLWESGEISPENFLELNCLKRQKMPLQKIEEMERVQHEREFLPLLPPAQASLVANA